MFSPYFMEREQWHEPIPGFGQESGFNPTESPLISDPEEAETEARAV
jgi:hypothetical protein